MAGDIEQVGGEEEGGRVNEEVGGGRRRGKERIGRGRMCVTRGGWGRGREDGGDNGQGGGGGWGREEEQLLSGGGGGGRQLCIKGFQARQYRICILKHTRAESLKLQRESEPQRSLNC